MAASISTNLTAAGDAAWTPAKLRMLMGMLVGIELRHTTRAPRCLEHGEVCIFICGGTLEEEFLLGS
jgi:hypothetical protein